MWNKPLITLIRVIRLDISLSGFIFTRLEIYHITLTHVISTIYIYNIYIYIYYIYILHTKVYITFPSYHFVLLFSILFPLGMFERRSDFRFLKKENY